MMWSQNTKPHRLLLEQKLFLPKTLWSCKTPAVDACEIQCPATHLPAATGQIGTEWWAVRCCEHAKYVHTMYVCMHICMYIWMYGCKYGWMDGWMDGWRTVHSKAVSEECSRDITKLAIWCNVKSASDSLEEKGIRKGTNAFLNDRSWFANHMMQPSALHARDGSAAGERAVHWCLTTFQRHDMTYTIQSITTLLHIVPPLGVAWPYNGSRTEGRKEGIMYAYMYVCICICMDTCTVWVCVFLLKEYMCWHAYTASEHTH